MKRIGLWPGKKNPDFSPAQLKVDLRTPIFGPSFFRFLSTKVFSQGGQLFDKNL